MAKNVFQQLLQDAKIALKNTKVSTDAILHQILKVRQDNMQKMAENVQNRRHSIPAMLITIWFKFICFFHSFLSTISANHFSNKHTSNFIPSRYLNNFSHTHTPRAMPLSVNSVTRLGDFLHIGQLFKAFGNISFIQIFYHLRQSL